MEPEGKSIGVMNEIITNISRTLSVSVDDIKSKSRKRELVEARVIFVNFSEKAGVHYEMAIDFINRHRTTIYHLRKAYIDWQSDLEFQKLLAKFDGSEKNEMCEEKKKYVDFFLWFRENGERYLGLSIEKLVDKYLENVERKDQVSGGASKNCKAAEVEVFLRNKFAEVGNNRRYRGVGGRWHVG